MVFQKKQTNFVSTCVLYFKYLQYLRKGFYICLHFLIYLNIIFMRKILKSCLLLITAILNVRPSTNLLMENVNQCPWSWSSRLPVLFSLLLLRHINLKKRGKWPAWGKILIISERVWNVFCMIFPINPLRSPIPPIVLPPRKI